MCTHLGTNIDPYFCFKVKNSFSTLVQNTCFYEWMRTHCCVNCVCEWWLGAVFQYWLRLSIYELKETSLQWVAPSLIICNTSVHTGHKITSYMSSHIINYFSVSTRLRLCPCDFHVGYSFHAIRWNYNFRIPLKPGKKLSASLPSRSVISPTDRNI